jgi:CheY-like chemotaxis protein
MSGFTSTGAIIKIKMGPIMLVEDSVAEQGLFKIALKELNFPNELIIFNNGEEALNYLKETEATPFIILSDINMPIMTGIELKMAVEKDPWLSLKAIPFVFISSSASPSDINAAFALKAQGYFNKPDNYVTLTIILKAIINYWLISEVPDFEGDVTNTD